jgi:putative ABC transport system permease protein
VTEKKMTPRRLLFRNLIFHRRGNLAVLLGVAVGAAVITGALLVGDSLRGSLREQALRRLAWVDTALVAPRFFRVPTNLFSDGHVIAGITLRATAESPNGSQVTGATIWATQSNFAVSLADTQPTQPDFVRRLLDWLPRLGPPAPPDVGWGLFAPFPFGIQGGEAWINEETARLGRLSKGDSIKIRLLKQSNIPRESLLGGRASDDAYATLTATIAGVLPELPANAKPLPPDAISDFSIAPGTERPRNVFLNLAWLQEQMGEPGRANALLANHHDPAKLQQRIAGYLNLDDWGLLVRTPESRTGALFAALDRNKDGSIQPNEWRGRLAEAVVEAADADRNHTLSREEIETYYRSRGYVSLESRQMLLEPAVERAALEAANELGLRAQPTLIYLANGISDGKETIPYSIIAAMDPVALPTLAGAAGSLKDDEILLADWKESPLAAKIDDTITVSYFEPELEGRIKESTAKFTFRGTVPMTGLAADPDIAPEFPGITDKLDIKEWDPPFPYDNKRIKPRDDDYWNRYRTTPKAYITLAAGRKLFGSRFGRATSIRLSTADGKTPDEKAIQQFEKALLSRLDPAAGGFVFEDVRARALAASTGGQDFGMLFLGFSFFLIAAALMLVGLLVRLNIERRASEVGLLLAAGFSLKAVRRLIVREGMLLGIAGMIVGLVLAAGYAALMLRLLGALWPDGSVGSFLHLHVSGLSLLIGGVGTLIAVWLTLRWAVRALSKVAPSALLAGEASPEAGATKRPTRAIIVAVLGVIAAAALMIGGSFARDAEARAGSFFGGGAALLTAILAAGWAWIRRPERRELLPGSAAIARFGARNTSRNPTRSLLTAALLAAAAFLLVAVESFRRSPEADFLSRTGGSGGFSLLAETDLPLYHEPSGPEGRQELLDALEKHWLQHGVAPEQVRDKLAAARASLDAATIIPLRRQAGDDASCLNLYQPGRPRVVGVPPSLIARGGFHFASSEGSKDNPWQLLAARPDVGTIPAIGEANTVQWMLKSSLGGTVSVRDGEGREVKLRIVALLQDSIFQGELLIADSSFRALFPRQEGFAELLVDPVGRDYEVIDLLTTAYADRGLSIAHARDKLQGYLQVENTYLSTFQILGAFGLLLGTLGLAVVLLRNVWERRREFALLRAVGYRRRDLGGLVLAENTVLVLFGLGAGVGAALLAVAPHAAEAGGGTPWARLAGLLALVLAAGLAAGLLAIRATVRAPLIAALRNE